VNEESIKKLVNRYIAVSFSVHKIAENLVKCEIGADLTNEQQYTLRYIHQVGECTSTELAEVFDVKKSAITAMINRMWEKGLINRNRDENDRRMVYLTLSEKGNDLFAKTEQRVQKLVGSFITRFDEEEIEQFIKTYEKLDKVIKECKQNQLEE
jgi:DNA-binding MarR family transcriptional regulator